MQNMDEMANYTSLRVEKEVRDDLDSLGKRRESYNEIIKRLILFYREHQGDQEPPHSLTDGGDRAHPP